MNIVFWGIVVVSAILVQQGTAAIPEFHLVKHHLQNETWAKAVVDIRDVLLGGNSDHRLIGNFREYQSGGNMDIEEGPVCFFCQMVAREIIELRRYGESSSVIKNIVVRMCEQFDIAPSHICRGMADLNAEIILYIIDNRPNLTANSFCGVLFQSQHCRLDDIDGSLDWSGFIDERNAKPANESKRIETAECDQEPLTIVHITDTHTDPLYAVGSLADCDEPVCCRKDVLGPSNGTEDQLAGRWGDYRHCDSPWEATLNVFEQIKANHKKIDYVYFTGDVIDHAIWRTTTAGNVKMIEQTFNALKQVFGDIPVLPVIGNHEPHPVNQFAPRERLESGLETRSLYTILANSWSKWLLPDALDTVRQSGFYTTLLRRGLRIIGLNNNDGSTYNFWLLYDAAYTSRQLQWLHDTLLAAERDGEKVHILVHFPNGHHDMHTTYSREYQRIVERFWDTISGQFNGHTHRDQFYVFYDRETSSKAINVAWNGGSATAFSNVNPNYRVYTVEPKTFQVIDHETWIYNLTEANQNRNASPSWHREYSFRDAFDTVDLSPASLDDLLNRFSKDPAMLQRYWQFKVKQGDPSLRNGCDKNCLAAELCSLATTITQPGIRNQRCMTLLEQWEVTNA